MEFDGCPLNSKMVQDIWRKNEECHHRFMETKLSEKYSNKDGCLRINVSLDTQLLSSFVVCMMETAIKDINISIHLKLKSWKYSHIINLAKKVDSLVDVCNSRSRNYEYIGLFTPESGLEMKNIVKPTIAHFFVC